MPRPLLIAILGVVTTVAVAWGLSWRLGDGCRMMQSGALRFPAPKRLPSYAALRVERCSATGGVVIGASVGAGSHEDIPLSPLGARPDFVDGWARPRVFGWFDSLEATGEFADWPHPVEGWGWPLIALWCDDIEPEPEDMAVRSPYFPRFTGGAVSIGLIDFYDAWRRREFRVLLPLRPVWTGLILDSALYAGAWWLLLLAPFAVVRRLRKHQGLCPRCAYDLKGLPHDSPCPECGDKPVTGAAPAS